MLRDGTWFSYHIHYHAAPPPTPLSNSVHNALKLNGMMMAYIRDWPSDGTRNSYEPCTHPPTRRKQQKVYFSLILPLSPTFSLSSFPSSRYNRHNKTCHSDSNSKTLAPTRYALPPNAAGGCFSRERRKGYLARTALACLR